MWSRSAVSNKVARLMEIVVNSGSGCFVNTLSVPGVSWACQLFCAGQFGHALRQFIESLARVVLRDNFVGRKLARFEWGRGREREREQ